MIGKGTLKALTSLVGLGCLGATLVWVADGPSAWAQPGTAPSTGSQGSGSQMPAPTTTAVEEMVTAPVTIEEIDKKARTITVKLPDGGKTTMNVPSDVNLDKAKKGDKIDVDYYRAMALEVMPPGSTPSAPQAQTTVARGPAGRMGAKQITSSAEIVSINRGTNTVVIKGANNKYHTVNVQNPEIQKKVQGLKPGDVVQMTYTEAVAAKLRPHK